MVLSFKMYLKNIGDILIKIIKQQLGTVRLLHTYDNDLPYQTEKQASIAA